MQRPNKLGLTVASIALASVFAAAQSNPTTYPSPSASNQGLTRNAVQVTVDGNPVTFPSAQPQLLGGRVLVPLRGVFEQMGAKVDWDPNTQTVMVDGAGRHIRLRIGSYDASVNGRVVTMDITPQLIQDSTMVPLRFLSQALGARVDWQPETNLVAITTSARPQRFSPPVQEPAPTPPPVVVNPTPPPIIVNPPAVIVQAPPAPTPPPAPETIKISRDNVIPMRLDVDLSSNTNHPGDKFIANVMSDNGFLPEGTVIEGYVRDAMPAGGSHGGTLDLRFTHIRFPDGNRYAITGCVAPLDNRNIIRTSEGRYVVRGGRDSVIARDAVIGAGAGLVIGAYNGRAVGGAALGGAIGAIVGAFDHTMAHNVIFPAGTRFGLILGESLTVDRNDLSR